MSITITGTSGNDALFGSAVGDFLRGEGGRDAIFGRGGDDNISGAEGRDILFGGAGADTFHFHTDLKGVDVIRDFEPGTDRIIIYDRDSRAYGTSAPWHFVEGGRDASEDSKKSTIIYNEKNGKLFFDHGRGGGEVHLLAKIGSGHHLSENDFSVVA